MIAPERALARFRTDATNSSHFVWFLADLTYFESSNGWIFGYRQIRDVTLIALEPLVPGAPTEYTSEHKSQFKTAWDEFRAEVKPQVAAFISCYGPFVPLLESEGFQTLKVGREPWMDLQECIPKGNAGKGVRSARNQALRAGLRVEEWKAADIDASPEKKALLKQIHREWSSARWLSLEGFLNATNPLAHSSDRRYFILTSPSRVEAYMVATTVPGINGYFLEDLVLRRGAPRGCGELLTLETMVALQEGGGKIASLGVVSMTSMEEKEGLHLPPMVRWLTVTVPKYFRKIYNFDGMEVYRKRFKPKNWQNIHIGVYNGVSGQSDSKAWLKVLLGLLSAFRPRIQITATWLWDALTGPIRNYPLTATMLVLNFALFAAINQFGSLPEWALTRFGFAPNAPWYEWPYRSLISDYLYFDPHHFYIWGLSFIATLYWAEKSHRLSFLLPLLFGFSLLDDIVNFGVLIRPFSYFQPHFFKRLILAKDVGSSLLLASVLGLQLCQFRKAREFLFAIGSISLVLIYAFTSNQRQILVANLNHALFFSFGYLAGKLKFEYSRHLSRLAARRKPPEAKSVLPPSERQNKGTPQPVKKVA